MALLKMFEDKVSTGSGPVVIEQITLDEVWRKAERLGRIEVDHPMGSREVYRARIQFNRKSGSMVWAEGNDTDIVRAMQAAIREAELLSR